MGAFYGSILVRTEDSHKVQKTLEQVAKDTNCRFLLGPVLNRWVSFFPNKSGQNYEISIQVARHLTNEIFHLIVHDDDIFAYQFYRNGQMADRYDSCPDYFQKVSDEERQACRGRPELFQHLLPKPAALNKLKALLAADGKKYVFERERMVKFVGLLGLLNALSSYEYLQAGERTGIQDWKKFVHIPDLGPEKEAERAAQAELEVEKERLQKQGILLAELLLPQQNEGGSGSIAWGTDNSNNGILLARQSFNLTKGTNDEQSATEFLSVQPPWSSTPQPLALKTNSTVAVFSMSPSGNWLAGGYVAGDWSTRVWDWRTKKLAFEVVHTQAVQWVEFSEDEKWVYTMSGNEFVATSVAEKRRVATLKDLPGARGAAVHPSGRYAVLGLQNQLAIVDLEKRRLLKNLRPQQKMEKMDRWLGLTDSQVLEKLQKDPAIMKRIGAPPPPQLENWIKDNRFFSFPSNESIFDVRFNPNGEQLFIASKGMRIFDWNKLFLAHEEMPDPELSVDAPRDNDSDPNSRPLAYSVRFDAGRKILISSCLAGVIQYLNVENGQAGALLKVPGELSVFRLEFTSDRQALCCHCVTRPNVENLNKRKASCVQVWNYPQLCRAAGLD